MIAYASHTHGSRNLGTLQRYGWRLLVTPDTYRGSVPLWPTGTSAPYALDNGAWGAFINGVKWDQKRFEKILNEIGIGADFIVVPDVVAAGLASLDLSLSWLPRLTLLDVPLLIAVQDGITPEHLIGVLNKNVGIFLGGTTEWKLTTMKQWGEFAHNVGCYFHVGRVNSKRRIRLCATANADSFDGTSCTRYSKNVPLLDFERRQISLQEFYTEEKLRGEI